MKAEPMHRLHRTEQCEKCPWRKTTDPHTIPDGYNPEKHRALKSTIASKDSMEQLSDALNRRPIHVMACHESGTDPCIGWLKNQLGQGNNLALRLAMRNCENLGDVKLHGEQHETFEDTLPKRGKNKRKKNLPTVQHPAKLTPR